MEVEWREVLKVGEWKMCIVSFIGWSQPQHCSMVVLHGKCLSAIAYIRSISHATASQYHCIVQSSGENFNKYNKIFSTFSFTLVLSLWCVASDNLFFNFYWINGSTNNHKKKSRAFIITVIDIGH